jgi:FkbM family methyltransferase
MNSGLKSFLYKFTRRTLNLDGFDLVKKGKNHKISSWGLKERLQQAKTLGFSPKTILDGGAFRGHWSLQAAGLFPGAQLILIEPNPYVQEMIKSNTSQISPVPMILNLALGESPKMTSFNIWRDPDSDQGKSLLNHVSGPASQTIQVNVETLYNILQKLSVFPDLIKLDLRGGGVIRVEGSPQNFEVCRISDH